MMNSTKEEIVFSVSSDYQRYVRHHTTLRLVLILLVGAAAAAAALTAHSGTAVFLGFVMVALFYSWLSYTMLLSSIRRNRQDILMGSKTLRMPGNRCIELSKIKSVSIRRDREGNPVLAFIQGPGIRRSRLGPGQLLDFRRYEEGEELLHLVEGHVNGEA